MTTVDPRPRAGLRDYIGLTKPRIIELLLVTTVPTMMLAAGGWPDLGLALWTLLGGALAAAGANVLNCYVDADIDALMPRTAHRASATGAVTPGQTVAFGLALSALSISVLLLFANALAASLAALAIIFYAGVYSLILKRRTAQNIVWGGIAGCFPVLIGWAAITSELAPAAWLLFLVIFLWTPPHYWPLAIQYREQYARAEIPMLPVVATDAHVAKQIRWYSLAMVAASLPLIAYTGWVYALGAVLSGAWFLFLVLRFERSLTKGVATGKQAMRVFHGSISYLALLFLAVGLDPLLS